MKRLLEIIEAATQGAWTLGKGTKTIRRADKEGYMGFIARVHIAGEGNSRSEEQQKADALYISTVNPELMKVLLDEMMIGRSLGAHSYRPAGCELGSSPATHDDYLYAIDTTNEYLEKEGLL